MTPAVFLQLLERLRGYVSSQCQRGFAERYSPFPRENPNEPRHEGRWLLSTATTRAAISMHGSQSRTEAETAAFGYPARALVFKQRVRKSDLWLSATCAVVTASDGLARP